MAVRNPAGLYSENQGIFNSTPYTQYALQKQAKEEALDKYYADLPKTINSAGMRVKDIGGFMNKINGVRDYYQKNRAAIKNPRLDNGKAQSTYQSMNTDASMDVNKSKDRAIREKAALDFHQGKLKQDERVPEDFWNDLNENAASIYENPDYKGFDVQKWAQAPPAFHQDKFIQKFKDVTPQVVGVKYEAIPDNPLKQMEVTIKQFTPDQKQAIKARATDEYQNSYSFSNSVLEDLANPEKKLQLEQVYADQFGAEPKTKNEYAAAKAIQLLQNDLVSKKPIDNLEEINRRKKAEENARDLRNFEQQKIIQAIGKANSKELIDYRKKAQEGGEETNNLWVTRYVDSIVDENTPTSKLFGTFPAQTKDYTPAPVLYEALGKPAKVKITKDGNFDVKYLKPDPADKEKLIPDESRNKIMTPEEVKLALGYKAATKKDLKDEMNKKQKGAKKDSLGILD